MLLLLMGINGSGVPEVPGPPATFYILKEDGDNLLAENNDLLRQE